MFEKSKSNLIFKSFLFISFIYAQSPQDIKKMKSEYERLEKQQKLSMPLPSGVSESEIRGDIPNSIIYSPYSTQQEQDTLFNILPHYGYNFFTSRDTVRFWENLPTPKGYLLGPGDEIILSLWGETQLRKTYTINRDGSIFDEKVGVLNLMGKTLEDANRYLEVQFSKIYSTLKKPKSSTYINVSIGKLRSINVSFVGNVNYPGVHPIHPFSDLVMGLIQAGGIDTTGTLREIKIKRSNSLIETIDFYDYLINGDMPKNTQLRDGDVVIVPNRLSRVTVDSSIARPGIYETNGRENLKEIIFYAGGFSTNASNKISIERLSKGSKNNRTTTKNFYVDAIDAVNHKIMNGDIILPLSIVPSVNKVEIIGQIKRPGAYNYYDGMTVIDLLELGGGFYDPTYRKSIYMAAAEIVRRDPDTKFEKIIKVNLNDITENRNNGKIELENLDRFVVRSNYNFFKKKNVKISGEVKIPGSYPLMSNNESLKNIIIRAGGLTQNALSDGISIFRDRNYVSKSAAEEIEKDEQSDDIYSPFQINQNLSINNDKWIRVAWQNDKVIMMPGDSIIIKRSPGTINVTGEVYNPGLIEYQRGKSLNYYIESAGGPTNNGDKNNVIVVYANGVVKPKKFLSSPKMRDGSTIIVNRKEISDNINIMELANNTLSIISTTVTILVLSQQISSN